MKSIIKYISLLLFSGLILPFYNSDSLKKLSMQVVPRHASAVNKTRAKQTGPAYFFIYQDIAEIVFPQLKN